MSILENNSRTYLQNLRTGAFAYGIATGFNSFGYLLQFVLSITTAFSFDHANKFAMSIARWTFYNFELAMGSFWIGIAALWLLTTAPDNNIYPEFQRSRLNARRTFIVAAIVSLLINLIPASILLSTVRIAQVIPRAITVVVASAWCMIYFTRLCISIRATDLAASFRHMVWLLPAIESAYFIATLTADGPNNNGILTTAIAALALAHFAESYLVLKLGQRIGRVEKALTSDESAALL